MHVSEQQPSPAREVSGIKATRRIKALLPATTVVVCSLSDDPADRAAADEAGADDWLPKDRAIDDLIPTVQRHLARRSLSTQVGRHNGGTVAVFAASCTRWGVRVA